MHVYCFYIPFCSPLVLFSLTSFYQAKFVQTSTERQRSLHFNYNGENNLKRTAIHICLFIVIFFSNLNVNQSMLLNISAPEVGKKYRWTVESQIRQRENISFL